MQLYSVIYTFVFGIIGLLFWKIGNCVRRYLVLRKKLSLVPGLPRHWLFGNSRKGQIEGSQSYVDIAVKQANAGHKVFCIWIGPIPIVSVTHADTYKQLLKQTNEKPKGPTDAYKFYDAWLGDGLLFSGGRKWERNRKLLTPAFHFDILNGYLQTMNEGSNVLLDKLAVETSDGKPVDIFPYLCHATLETILKCSLSYEGNIQIGSSAIETGYIQCISRLFTLGIRRTTEVPFLIKPIFDMHPAGREFYRLCDQAHEFTGNIIQSRIEDLKEQKSDNANGKKRRLDFLDILLTAKDEEGRGLSQQEIKDEVDTFTFAGHDTTASAISWTIYALGKYPDLQQKVYKDVCNVLGDSNTVTKDHLGEFVYLQMFVKEVLRYFTIVPLIGRTHNTSPIILDGKEIPPNVSVWIQVYAIHHNEDIWPNHMVFDPERFNVNQRDNNDSYGFIPFSAGSRNCIGQAFAMNEIKINVAKFVKRFEVALDPTKEAILLPNFVMRGEKGINVCLKTRE